MSSLYFRSGFGADVKKTTGILTVLASVFVAARFGWTWTGLAAGIACALFIFIGVFDYKHCQILNAVVLPAAVCVLIINALIGNNVWHVLGGGFSGVLLFAAAKWVTPRGLGDGDIKLAGLIGVVFGFPNALLALTIGVVAGGAIVVYLITARGANSKTKIPYAPSLCLGAITFLLLYPSPFFIP